MCTHAYSNVLKGHDKGLSDIGIHVCMYLHTYVCMYLCMYVRTPMYLFTYVCMYAPM